MKTEHAFKVVKNLRRYHTGKRRQSRWATDGLYTPQALIPKCTAAQKREAERIMAKGLAKHAAIRWVDVPRIRSWQNSLRHRSLIWNVSHFDRMQRTTRSKDMDVRGKTLPIIVWANGAPVVWNGNHRVTSAILLGRGRILARCFKKIR